MNSEKKKFRLKVPNTNLLIFSLLILIAALTWIIPGGEYERTTLSRQGRVEAALELGLLAEGFERGTTQELLTFLYIARGSTGEVRSMLCFVEMLPAFQDFKSEISNSKFSPYEN